MRLSVNAADLIETLGIIAVVEARSLTATPNSAAYLFDCSFREGQPWMRAYSRGAEHVARAGCRLVSLDVPGQFTLPVGLTRTIESVAGDDTVAIEVPPSDEGQAAVRVIVESSGGLRCDLPTYDARLISTCEREYEAATGTSSYSAPILRTALCMAEPFLPDRDAVNCADRFHSVRIFDQTRSNPEWQNGDGYMFCSDGVSAFYFQSPDFVDKPLAIHHRDITPLVDFLGKCAARAVHVSHGDRCAFVASSAKDALLGWRTETATHDRFAYPPIERDTHVLRLRRAALRSALDAMPDSSSRARLVYESLDDPSIRFVVDERTRRIMSVPVEAGHGSSEPPPRGLELTINLARFLSLVDTRRDELELRIRPWLRSPPSPPSPPGAWLCTVEDLALEGADGEPVSCKVTRLMVTTGGGA